MSCLLLLFFIWSHRLFQIWIWFKTVNLLITCVQIHITYASKNDYICTNIVQLCKYPSHVPPWEISQIIYLNTEEILVQYLITFLVSHQYWQTPYKNHAVNPSTSSISYDNFKFAFIESFEIIRCYLDLVEYSPLSFLAIFTFIHLELWDLFFFYKTCPQFICILLYRIFWSFLTLLGMLFHLFSNNFLRPPSEHMIAGPILIGQYRYCHCVFIFIKAQDGKVF